MAKIFWDTNLFIYLFEGDRQFSATVTGLRQRMLQRNDQLVTSAMTVGEILVKPIATGNAENADRYRALFASHQITVCAFDMRAADAYARIRQDRGIQPVDAIQLACAAASEVDLFITNDDRLSKKSILGVSYFVTSLTNAPL